MGCHFLLQGIFLIILFLTADYGQTGVTPVSQRTTPQSNFQPFLSRTTLLSLAHPNSCFYYSTLLQQIQLFEVLRAYLILSRGVIFLYSGCSARFWSRALFRSSKNNSRWRLRSCRTIQRRLHLGAVFGLGSPALAIAFFQPPKRLAI